MVSRGLDFSKSHVIAKLRGIQRACSKSGPRELCVLFWTLEQTLSTQRTLWHVKSPDSVKILSMINL